MDIALITGADSALGLALVERLLRQGFRVHGLGNNFSSVTLSHPEFHAHAVDLTDVSSLHQCVESILATEGAVHQLIHAVDVSPGTPFHQQTVGGVEGVLRIGLTGPVMITRLVLPNLIRFRGGLVFFLASGKPGFHSNATCGLIEGGLRRFASELLQAHRDGGLKVSTVLLQHNTELPSPPADVGVSKQVRVDLLDVADLIERIVAEGAPNNIGEITVYPRTGPHAESLPAAAVQVDPYREIRLPPKDKRPEEKTPIPTEKPSRPQQVLGISDEELEERIAEVMEEYANNPERYDPALQPSQERGRRQDRPSRGGDQRRNPVERQPAQSNGGEGSENDTSSAGGEERGGGDRRKKRRRNRNRKRDREHNREKQGNSDKAGASSQGENKEEARRGDASPSGGSKKPEKSSESAPGALGKDASASVESSDISDEKGKGDPQKKEKARPRGRGKRGTAERESNRNSDKSVVERESSPSGKSAPDTEKTSPNPQPKEQQSKPSKRPPKERKTQSTAAEADPGTKPAKSPRKTAAPAVKKTARKQAARKTARKTTKSGKVAENPLASEPRSNGEP